MSTPCSYGGLVYGYTTTHVRFWQPGLGNGVSNGALICLSHVLAEGTNQQATHDGTAYVKQWELGKRIGFKHLLNGLFLRRHYQILTNW